uniref:DNA helicase Pif1-like 2B domain-containing protein n=1 Tax=Lactuca sativa TaxID=4236 RepID=A0A9R1XWF9_LACSA|nr:hypothetical protein LSAT_V11C200059100 [Lactuca sativa]
MELLNMISVSHLPPHYIRLEVGCLIILLRNLDPSNGLCNDTRLICKRFQHNFIDLEIAIGQHAIKNPYEDDMFQFKLKRKHFPIQLCFAMTINKTQGQRYSECRYVYSRPSIRTWPTLCCILQRGLTWQYQNVSEA